MTDEEFETLVVKGIEALRPDILAKLDNVAIVIADEPSSYQKAELQLAEGEVIFGLYEGIPRTERSVMDVAPLPDKITIFKKAILDTYEDPDDIAMCIENTVWHEVAHHFGFSEDMVRQEELKRGRSL